MATNLNESFSFQLDDFGPIDNGWQNYVMGVVFELQQMGAAIAGFDATFMGDVPIGSGMSSSAALECSLAYGLNELFQLKFSKQQLIKACQLAEHHFVGTKCGIMDQFASVMGQKSRAIFLDCRSMDYSYLPCNLGHLQFLLLNTNVAHSLASSEYNVRRATCEASVTRIRQQFFKVESLRDVDSRMLETVKPNLSEIEYKRCRHVISENNRVESATQALLHNDFQQLGKLMYDSHRSLQNDYEVSCPELDFLVQQSLDKTYILGSRMMGGGFGGCTINLIEKSKVDDFVAQVAPLYQKQFGLELTAYTANIADGTRLV